MSRADDAKALFAPLAPSYDRSGALLSFGQDPRWRRFLVSQTEAGPESRVLDVATGTGAVALELVRVHGCRVVGVDQSPEMLTEAARRCNGLVALHEASADSLPFVDRDFDALTFTYLLRYVDDPAATLRELARVVAPGGTIAGLEFGVPGPLWRLPWELYVRAGLPAAGALLGGGWRRVGSFLGPSIRDFYSRWPLARLEEAWRAAGIEHVRSYKLSFGAGVVTWGRRIA